MAIREILMLGDERLYEASEVIRDKEKIQQVAADLRDTMAHFVEEKGFGRAIAAPQIGEAVRMIYMNMEGKETVFVNPEIVHKSQETFWMWDDCMSYPGLEVHLLRHGSITVTYEDLEGKPHEETFTGDKSELFQHELSCPSFTSASVYVTMDGS